MVMRPWMYVALFVAAVVIVFGAGWQARGVVAHLDAAKSKLEQSQVADDQRQLTMKVEAAQGEVRQESSKRLDTKAVETQVQVKYVTQEVVRYVASPDSGKCDLNAGWVRAYNASLGGVGAVPSTAGTGPTPAGAPGRVSGAAAGQ